MCASIFCHATRAFALLCQGMAVPSLPSLNSPTAAACPRHLHPLAAGQLSMLLQYPGPALHTQQRGAWLRVCTEGAHGAPPHQGWALHHIKDGQHIKDGPWNSHTAELADLRPPAPRTSCVRSCSCAQMPTLLPPLRSKILFHTKICMRHLSSSSGGAQCSCLAVKE